MRRGDLPNKIGPRTASTDAHMNIHAPSKSWFLASLTIAVIAVLGALSPIPYITTYATWVAILAYIVLAVSSLAQT
jgi:hypothetical protein